MTASAVSPARIVVVDSSVAVKWFKSADESALNVAWHLLERHRSRETTLVAPGHFAAEVLNGMQYAGVPLETLKDVAAALHGFDLVTVPLTHQLTSAAVVLAREHDLTINDALFPALAMLLECELFTADRAHARVTECAVRLLR
ncbi:MAG: type II toxin-antitoxin system VapC family toxin [Coriobacteriia bacterium]